jgi:hypothetical protein
MYKVLAVILIISGIFACKKSSNSSPVATRPDSILAKYMITDMRLNTSAKPPGTAYFIYNGTTLLERMGGFIPLANGSGFAWKYIKDMYDTLQYETNRLIIETKPPLGSFNLIPDKRIITLENGLMKTSVMYVANAINDTTVYFYGQANKISKTERYFGRGKELKTFEFNSQGNLEKVTTTLYDRFSDVVNTTILETFSNYDQVSNPLKNFWMWDDIFYRTLSNNNFAKYNYARTVSDNSQVQTAESIVPLQYDANGQVTYSR